MKLPDTLTRATEIVDFTATAPDGPIRAALSSEAPVERIFGPEILSHAEDAIDLSQVGERGLALTANHAELGERALPIGRVHGLRVEDGRLRGDLHFDAADPAAMDVRGKVERGIATDVSITYQPLDASRDDDTVTITRWRPLAASIVTIPADPSVGIGRSREDLTMTNPAAPSADALAAGRREAAAIHQRARELAERYPAAASRLNELADAVAADTAGTADTFGSRALDVIGELGAGSLAGEPSPVQPTVPMGQRAGLVLAGDDEIERQGFAMSRAMLHLARPEAVADDEIANNPFVGWRMIDLAEHSLRLAGHDTRSMSPMDIAKAAIAMPTRRHRALGARAISPGTAQYVTSDFPAMTENVAFKAMFDGFQTAPRTWDLWCTTGGAPDFRTFTVPRLTAIELMPIVAENASYGNLARRDYKEEGTLQKRGGLHSLSWEAVLNNDINGFSDVMAALGESAQATVDNYVYTKHIGNPTMGDGVALFAAGHNNDLTNDLGAPGIVNTRVAMERQALDVDKDTAGDQLRAMAPDLSFILVPPESWDLATELAGAEYLEAASGSGAQRVNTLRNTFVPLKSHLLPAAGADEKKHVWYALSRRGQTARVFFLNGNQAPILERESAWDTDAVHYKGKIVFDVVPQDWLGYVRNTPAP